MKNTNSQKDCFGSRNSHVSLKSNKNVISKLKPALIKKEHKKTAIINSFEVNKMRKSKGEQFENKNSILKKNY